MFRKILLLFNILILLSIQTVSYSEASGSKSSAALNAGTENKVPPGIQWPHEKSDLRPDPNLVFGRLANGFRYVLMENHKPEDRVSMHLDVQAGSMDETDDQQGLAHFLEHMLFCGSEHFKPGELVKYFQSIGMQFGADANAHTGFYETVYDVHLPEGGRESLEKGLLVMKDYAAGALLLPSEIDRERRVILAEKLARDSASYRIFESTLKFELPDSKISKRLPIGLEEVIKKADQKRLKEFYDTWYRPETMILVMVGDFDALLAASLIEERFASLSARAPARTLSDTGEIKHVGIKPLYHFEKETGSTNVSIEVVKKVFEKPDSLAYQQAVMVKDMADRIVNNRLEELVSKAGTPFTSASISSGIYLHHVEYAQISSDCSPENGEKALVLLEQTLRKAQKYGFTPSELARVKKEYLSELDEAVKTAPTRDSNMLARHIIRSLNNDRVFQSPMQKRERFATFIDSISLKKVNDSFKKTWAPAHRLVLVTGNAKLGVDDKSPENRIRGVFDNSTRVGVSRPIKEKVVVFPYLPEPEKSGAIAERTPIPDLGIVRIDFENGVRLNLKKTDFKANEVTAVVAFGRGRSAEPLDKPGLAGLSTQVMNESGLGRLKPAEIDRALAGKNTSVFFNVDEDAFVLMGRSISEEIPLLFQLFYAYLKDPAYRQDAYTLTIERFGQKYRSLSHSIEGAIALSGKRFLAGGDSRFGLPSYEDFKKNTLDNVRSWTAPSLNKDALEVSVAGDFDVETVVETASRYLGSLPKRCNAPVCNANRIPKFPVGQSLDIPVPTRIPKALVTVAYPTEDFWDIHRTRRLTVLGRIFSEKLRKTIREQLGAAYSPYAYNLSSRAYPGYGVFQAVVETEPKDTQRVVREVKKIADALAKNGVTPEELRLAVDPLLTGIKDFRKTNDYWLNHVLKGSKRHPVQLDWSRTMMEDYAVIRAEEISRLAKTYLDNVKAAVIIVKPE
jgi:zinc protease